MIGGVWVGSNQMFLGFINHCRVGTLEINLILPMIWKRGKSVSERANVMFNVVQISEMKVSNLLPELALSPERSTRPGEAGDGKVSAGEIWILLREGRHKLHDRVLRTTMLMKELSVLIQLGLH
jgi:hypothetical protein